ncbi:hypothetical protein MVES1_003568 [Malassezia vespertilionis]|uniref:Uncharacterized protein n=1 Tax=Malassezia vespertilionis TaxID=2020962 RepID=A0A2N1J8R7_9BASI|nr:uncharacterized protein MVES1_003568 [Malassezia vespertilionis]PKI82955.1 hypothetical protein MVES_003142 [Malassezia vespertilionis]WFD08197.1 hypothetical protein MVES1_003568 [Malassezia vespertilionis]
MPGTNVPLIVGLSAGLGGGILFIITLGLISGMIVRRSWRLKRQASIEHAGTAALYSTDGASEKMYMEPMYDEENTIDTLFNIPEEASKADDKHPTGESDSTLLLLRHSVPDNLRPMLTAKADDTRFPYLGAENTDEPNVQWSLNPNEPKDLATPNDTYSPPNRTLSSKYKRSLSRMRSKRLSTRRQTVLSRLPSQFRTGRSSRRVSLDSQEGSIGLPDRELPMARRGTMRFQYDSSSHGSQASPHMDWNEAYYVGMYNDEPEPEPAMPSAPPPAVLAKERSPVDRETLLQERITAWQESSMVASDPSEKDEVYELPSQRTMLRRAATQSTVISSYSYASIGEVMEPYLEASRDGSLAQIFPVQPHAPSVTALEEWLQDEDPRYPLSSAHTNSTGLFGEVEFATALNHAVSEEAASTGASPMLLENHRNSMDAAKFQEVALRHKPRTPSPLAMYASGFLEPAPPVNAPSGAQLGVYAASSSSRSSFPVSARFSNDLPRSWKHNSYGTASTEITSVEGNAELEHAAKLEHAKRDSALGPRVLLPTDGNKLARHLTFSSASSDSVATHLEAVHAPPMPKNAWWAERANPHVVSTIT